jgi:hypothetical protein
MTTMQRDPAWLAKRMRPNPPVNADACGRAAMRLGCRARAGYRARYTATELPHFVCPDLR